MLDDCLAAIGPVRTPAWQPMFHLLSRHAHTADPSDLGLSLQVGRHRVVVGTNVEPAVAEQTNNTSRRLASPARIELGPAGAAMSAWWGSLLSRALSSAWRLAGLADARGPEKNGATPRKRARSPAAAAQPGNATGHALHKSNTLPSASGLYAGIFGVAERIDRSGGLLAMLAGVA